VPTNLDTYQLSSKNFFLCSLLPFTAQATSNKLQQRITCIWNLGRITVFGTVGGSNDGRQQQPVDRMLYQRRMDL
jgi:hypothetical protein